MGGYGFYIWTSYILTGVLFVGLYLSARMRRKQLIQQISVQKTVKRSQNQVEDEQIT